MKRVYKYPLLLDEPLVIPAYLAVVHCGYQGNDLFIWAEYSEPNQSKRGYKDKAITVYGTGHDIPTHLCHLATVHSPDGNFIWHIYEGPA